MIVTLRRNKVAIASVIGASITSTCTNNIQNYNAWVGADAGKTITAISPALALTSQVCVQGWGVGTYNNLCVFTCQYGYW